MTDHETRMLRIMCQYFGWPWFWYREVNPVGVVMLKFYKWGEISIDFHQWSVGFNYYREWGLGLNLFLGPLRIMIGKPFNPEREDADST